MKKFFIACAAVIICRLLAAFILPTFDDAFITYRYSQNLVDGNGFVYNINEKVMGTTAPLFGLIACIPALLSVSVPKFFVLFNLLCDIGSLYLIYKFFLKKDFLPFIFFVLLFAAEPQLNRIGIGGMEANLFLFSSLSGLVLYISNKKVYAVILLSLIYFLRPEAVLLLFVLFIYEIYSTRKIPFKYAVISIITFLIPLLCIYLYYGQVLPQSVVAKGQRGRVGIAELLQNVLFPNPVYFLIFFLGIFGFIKSKKEPLLFLAGIWVYLFAFAYIASGSKIWTWYVYSIEVVQILLASVGLSVLLKKSQVTQRINHKVYYSLPVFAVLTWIGVYAYKGRSTVEKNIYAELKKDFDTLSNKNLVFFADDIGALGYFTHAYIYDNLRLVTPQAANFNTTYDRIIDVKPKYIFLYPVPKYINMIKNDPALAATYTFIKRYSVNGEKTLPVTFTKSDSTKYRQDYVLYKRND